MNAPVTLLVEIKFCNLDLDLGLGILLTGWALFILLIGCASCWVLILSPYKLLFPPLIHLQKKVYSLDTLVIPTFYPFTHFTFPSLSVYFCFFFSLRLFFSHLLLLTTPQSTLHERLPPPSLDMIFFLVKLIDRLFCFIRVSSIRCLYFPPWSNCTDSSQPKTKGTKRLERKSNIFHHKIMNKQQEINSWSNLLHTMDQKGYLL